MRIDLWQGKDMGEFMPYMECFILDTPAPRGAVVVCPGGGYVYCSRAEGEPVAMAYAARGLHAFVLRYSCGPDAAGFAPLAEVSWAIGHIREHAQEWGIDPNKIAVCGFSAGGHLAGTSGLYYQDATHVEGDEADQFSARPDAMLLCYPVIAATEEFSHKGSANNLLGVDAPLEARQKMDLHKAVTEDTPPAFIWHTVTDQVVPVKNALAFGNAMIANNRLCEMHIFPQGPHGRGLGFACHALAQWSALAANFLDVTLGFPRGRKFTE
jgi:acetyl esterase/lipase